MYCRPLHYYFIVLFSYWWTGTAPRHFEDRKKRERCPLIFFSICPLEEPVRLPPALRVPPSRLRPSAQEAPRGAPDQPTGQNYTSCGKKMINILSPAVKNGQNFASSGKKTVLLF
jgi:hypothetical protein